MMLVDRPDYRIDSRTIKRGSRPSILFISFVESSNLCIIGIIFIGSYLALIMVWSWCLSCLSCQGQVHRKQDWVASSIAFSVVEILPVHPWGMVPTFLPITKSHFLVLIWLFYMCGFREFHDLQDKLKFIKNGICMKTLLRFLFWRFTG